MPPSHVFSRGLDLDRLGTPVIVSIIVGTIAINIAVGMMWFFFKTDRPRLGKKEKGLAEPSPEFPSVPVVSISLPRPSLITQSRHKSVKWHHEDVPMGSTNSQRRDHRPTSVPCVHWNHIQDIPPLLTQYSRPVRASMPLSTVPNLQRGLSVRSDDSASVYSSASAPISFHEHTYRPLTLEPVPISQATMQHTTAPLCPWPKRISRVDDNEYIPHKIAPMAPADSQTSQNSTHHSGKQASPSLISLAQPLPLNPKPHLPSLSAPITAHPLPVQTLNTSHYSPPQQRRFP
ncbi:hypothetical protein BD779DRAFT_1669566 [Infundibulicybe gibba]|nr:hypothetical protein BD779DRAFT_1669566 [Infundibulicybe gibba]